MHKAMLGVVVAALLCGVIAPGALAATGDMTVKVYVNGKLQRYNPPAIVRGATTYVPLRQGANSLGLHVTWHADQNAAQICSDIACILIPKKDGIIVNGRLLLPLRKMGESLGADVKWNSKKKTVSINKQKDKPKVPKFE